MATFNFVNRTGKSLRPFEMIERYITNAAKAKSGFIGRRMVDDDIAGCMNFMVTMCGVDDDAELLHFVLTFSPEEVNEPKTACGFAEQITDYIATKYQVCYAVHEDTENLHVHFVFNSMSYLDGRCFKGTEASQQLTDFVARILHYRGGITLDRRSK